MFFSQLQIVLGFDRFLVRDLTLHAVKIGMLATDDVARNVELGLDELDRGAAGSVPLVVDPVLSASDGTALLERRAMGSLGRIIGRARLVTPNLSEAETLTGRDLSSDRGIEQAARDLVGDFGAGAALVTGGHRDGPPHDLLAIREEDGVTLDWLEGERIGGGPVHGTGCALASAIAAQLAKGDRLRGAVGAARSFIEQALRAAKAAGSGARFLVLS